MGRCLPAPLIASILVAVACGTTEVPVFLGQASLDAAVGPPDSGISFADGGTLADYCSGTGPPVLVGADGGVLDCSGSIAGQAFRFAACICQELVTNHSLTTDAFDGKLGAWSAAAQTLGGSVGANGGLNASAPLTVGGSLWVGGAVGMQTSASATIGGELHVTGQVNSGPTLHVGTDAWLAGGLLATGDVLIDGTLTLPPGATVSVGGMKTIGATAIAPVSVPAPCDCQPSSLVDVARLVDSHSGVANDDAAAHVDPTLLANVTSPIDHTLPCGRLYLTRIDTHAPVHLMVQGRTAVFVGGDFHAQADFRVDVPQGTELDLFIKGTMLAAGALQLGDPTNPARARTYVGGSGTVDLQGASELSGNLYAPNAQIVLGGGTVTVFGSLFADGLNSNADLIIHFDESVALSGSECPKPATCTGCECGQLACRGGACVPCKASGDCCAPAVCRSENCVLDIR